MNVYANKVYTYNTKTSRSVFLGDVNFLFPVILPSGPMFFYRALRNVTNMLLVT